MNIFKLKTKQAFTLIELLIVIGILGILIVTVLVLLNPGETQRKARDLRRIKDAQTLQAILSQYLTEHPDASTDQANSGNPCFSAGCFSNVGGPVTTTSQPCNANWLDLDVCSYAQSVPVDPSNNAQINFVEVTAAGVAQYLGTTNLSRYKIAIEGTDYEINVRQESLANKDRLTSDTGDANAWMELGTKLTIMDNTP